MHFYLKKNNMPSPQDICVANVRNVLSANMLLITFETQEV